MQTTEADSASRLVRFRDLRSPQEIRRELERAHMVLLRATRAGGRLTLEAHSQINGAPYDLFLVFEAALHDTNCYSLRIAIHWQTLAAAARDHHRKAAPGWLDYWMRDYTPAAPVSTGDGIPLRYETLVDQALSAELQLDSVAKVQQDILARMRRGASFSTAHKEGGTRIYWRGDRFVRSDYGDNEAEQEFADEAAFLAFLRRFFDWETSRSVHPGKVDDATAWKLISRLLQEDAAPPARHSQRSNSSDARTTRERHNKLRLIAAVTAAGVILAGVFGWNALMSVFTVKTIGAPIAPAVGTPEHVAILVRTQEPYVPSLHRDPSKDRYRISLLLQPREATKPRQLLPLVGNLDASESQHAVRMLGFDGKIVWFISRDITGYDESAKRLVRLEDLRRANPSLDHLWPIGFFEVEARLQVSTRDRRIQVEIEPDTLIARTQSAPRIRTRAIAPHPAQSMLVKLPIRADGALDAAYVRESIGGPPLRLAAENHTLLTYWRKLDGLERMLCVARVDADGKRVWEVESGIGDLQQVLPDPNALALVGTRPRVPDKVSEPILVIIRNDTGTRATTSLWIPN